MAIAYWIFVSFLIVGTFIDFEHFIIPDQVTIGGTIAGVACSVVVPALMQTDSRVAAGVRAALAAALGYVILWIVLEAGKIAFGRKRIEFDAPTTFTWKKRDDDADFIVGTEEESLERIFRPRKRSPAAPVRRSSDRRSRIWKRDARFSLRSRECGWRRAHAR